MIPLEFLGIIPLLSFSVGLASLCPIHLFQLELHLSSANLEMQNSWIWIASAWGCVFTLKITQKILRSREVFLMREEEAKAGAGDRNGVLVRAPAPHNEEELAPRQQKAGRWPRAVPRRGPSPAALKNNRQPRAHHRPSPSTKAFHRSQPEPRDGCAGGRGFKRLCGGALIRRLSSQKTF